MKRNARRATAGRGGVDRQRVPPVPAEAALPAPAATPAPRPVPRAGRRPYQQPRLESFGDLWARTTGFTGDIADSGGKMLEDPFPFYGGYSDVP